MKKFIVGLAFVQIFYSTAIFAAPGLDEYGYAQRVQMSPVSTSTTVSVELPIETQQVLDDKFSNLQVVNARNEHVPFTIYKKRQGLVTSIEDITVSSRKSGDKTALVDNDRLTEFFFDEKVDGSEPSTLLVDFGKPIDIHRMKVWTRSVTPIRGLGLKMGNNPSQLKTVKAKSLYTNLVDGVFPKAQFAEVSFWGPEVKIEDVLFYERDSVQLYFTAEPGMTYDVLSGNPEVSFVQYSQWSNSPSTATVQADLSRLTFNRLATDDLDKDGIKNSEDNCPFNANTSQKDKDGDNYGDICDNAPSLKNFYQSDVDSDGVADLLDNCKINANPEQYDADKDEIGDVCDFADNSGAKKAATVEAISKGAVSPLFIGGLILLLLGIGAFVLKKHKK